MAQRQEVNAPPSSLVLFGSMHANKCKRVASTAARAKGIHSFTYSIWFTRGNAKAGLFSC